jgi:short-subunit dehydrogenase
MMKTFANAIAVVTGAGSGIGRAVACEFASRGCDLALADIDEAGLAQTRAALPGNRRVTTSRVDVAALADMTRLRDEVARDFGRVSVLVNNAGVALYGRFEDLSVADLQWIMGINFWGAVYGCQLFLSLLLREPAANIVTLSSLFGIVAPPMQIGYSASKFAVRGFSEALRHELAPTTVRVTVVHPGGIRTNIAKTTRRGEGADEARFARDTKKFDAALTMPPPKAAKLIAEAILRDRARLLIGNDAHAVDAIVRAFPALYMKVLQPVFDPKKRFVAGKSADR